MTDSGDVDRIRAAGRAVSRFAGILGREVGRILLPPGEGGAPEARRMREYPSRPI